MGESKKPGKYSGMSQEYHYRHNFQKGVPKQYISLNKDLSPGSSPRKSRSIRA
jgi:hypothetical protein